MIVMLETPDQDGNDMLFERNSLSCKSAHYFFRIVRLSHVDKSWQRLAASTLLNSSRSRNDRHRTYALTELRAAVDPGTDHPDDGT